MGWTRHSIFTGRLEDLDPGQVLKLGHSRKSQQFICRQWNELSLCNTFEDVETVIHVLHKVVCMPVSFITILSASYYFRLISGSACIWSLSVQPGSDGFNAAESDLCSSLRPTTFFRRGKGLTLRHDIWLGSL